VTWVMWNIISVHLVIVLLLMYDRCMFCTEHTTVLEIVLDAPDGTPRLQGSCGIHFGPFGDSVSVCARLEHGLRRTYDMLRNCFGRTRGTAR
jgi:hypothetical protein